MTNIFKIAFRNLLRYRRRTLLTATLVTLGVVFVLVFTSVSGSFKQMMISQITDSMMGHLQIHRKGYVAAIDTLPLNLGIKQPGYAKLEALLQQEHGVAAYSPRIKFGGMFSNFMETTNIRLNGIIPEKEFAVVPFLPERVSSGVKTLKQGEIMVPELLARGMNVKVGDTVVIVATNQSGSVNGKQFLVSAVLESASGPGGRDGYLHFDDAVELLRMEQPEISEVAIRLKKFGALPKLENKLRSQLEAQKNPKGKPVFELHSWEALSPFARIAKMLDLMTLFIKIMLVSIVLISIMNVMMMAVFERVREIGTIAAIGTPPATIRSLFLVEGLCLGLFGAVAGTVLGSLIILIINLSNITFSFGQQTGLLLKAYLEPGDILMVSVIVVVVSVLATLQPAIKASRMQPVDALRHV
ncbi:MAG: ABC transporter permease [Trichlorobacter sp.]|uniref:ABC transporter permease n=1 Tax=Trichlorobacter sp. TaxID=2911007 RepID=UPI00256A5900|nr:FtsX-like permease family protein [Trichlorobacter sp.]MDK9718709.1 ABC transporter permease [Trichlorobacter sp.]